MRQPVLHYPHLDYEVSVFAILQLEDVQWDLLQTNLGIHFDVGNTGELQSIQTESIQI